jgi:alkylhydroperoxidase/carboxymuconolactone decarboxylase family protein YurZ
LVNDLEAKPQSIIIDAMSKLPKRYTEFMKTYPRVGDAYRELGDAVAEAGPLDAKTRALIKLGFCIGANMEGAAHSQARKALEAGATPEELRHAALQATTTLGFPNMMRAMAWVEDVLAKA